MMKHISTDNFEVQHVPRNHRSAHRGLNLFSMTFLFFIAIAVIQTFQLGKLVDDVKSISRDAITLRTEQKAIINTFVDFPDYTITSRNPETDYFSS